MTMFVNLLAIALLITGGYGVKYVFDQQRDIKEAEERRQELLLSQQKEAKKLQEELQKKKEEESKTNKYRNFEKLKKQNSDVVGWLKMIGVKVDMPVVKHKNNVYYLTHDFDKKYNSMGWIFADYQNTFPDLSTNTIIYGHSYRSTTMFSNLKNALKNEWLSSKSKQTITLDTEKERLKFEVFSVYTIPVTDDYLYISFKDKEEYNKYLKRELKRSVKDFKVDVTTDDKIITLSTCYNTDKERLVIHGKLKKDSN
ncbi:MAG: class B sortase [bacterium]|nr:class B sortase [bacterium]